MKFNELAQLIEEAYFEVLAEQATLKPSSQEILGKFPTVRRTLEDILTPEYPQFVKDVKWVAPKPSTFEVVLQNGEQFFLRWGGSSFFLQVAGKSYDISKVSEYQRALNRVNDLLKTGPIRTVSDMEAEEEERDTSFADDFEGTGDLGDIGDLPTDTDTDIDFEEPEEEPDFDL